MKGRAAPVHDPGARGRALPAAPAWNGSCPEPVAGPDRMPRRSEPMTLAPPVRTP